MDADLARVVAACGKRAALVFSRAPPPPSSKTCHVTVRYAAMFTRGGVVRQHGRSNIDSSATQRRNSTRRSRAVYVGTANATNAFMRVFIRHVTRRTRRTIRAQRRQKRVQKGSVRRAAPCTISTLQHVTAIYATLMDVYVLYARVEYAPWQRQREPSAHERAAGERARAPLLPGGEEARHHRNERGNIKYPPRPPDSARASQKNRQSMMVEGAKTASAMVAGDSVSIRMTCRELQSGWRGGRAPCYYKKAAARYAAPTPRTGMAGGGRKARRRRRCGRCVAAACPCHATFDMAAKARRCLSPRITGRCAAAGTNK